MFFNKLKKCRRNFGDCVIYKKTKNTLKIRVFFYFCGGAIPTPPSFIFENTSV